MAYLTAGILDGHAAKIDGTYLADHDITFGCDFLTDGSFVGSPNVDDYFVTGAEAIVGRCSHVFVRLEGECAVAEYVMPENRHRGRNRVFRCNGIFQEDRKTVHKAGVGIIERAGKR